MLVAACLPTAAQNISASLSGTITDSLGAVFPGLEVKAASAQTGFTRATVTNAEGFFSFPDLRPSTYTLAISAPGFKKYTQSEIVLNSGDQRSLGTISLALGDTAESVTVTAEASPIQLGSGERAGVISAEELDTMALRGRDFMDAVGLLPGVVDTSDSREAPSPRSIGDIYILGGRSNSKNMTVDGVTNLDTGSNGSVHSMPSMDSVSEIKVLMSNYAPEHGRNAGGTVTVITKGGGKRLRGSAAWYNRHENYSANDFFNNRNGIPRQPYRYNIFSYTVGGPVYIPKVFNKDRSKLFFFWSQEFQRQRVSYQSRTVRVPTAPERMGDFSDSRDVNGRLIAVNDPLNESAPFPGNVAPASRHHAVGKAVLELFPMPNFVDPAPTRRYQWNYISALSGGYPRRTEIIRLDYSPHANVQTYLRMSNNADEQHPWYGLWVAGSLNFPLTPIVFRAPGRGATLHSTVTLSPTLFNEAIFGVSQNKLFYFPEFPERVTRQATGINIPQFNPDLNPGGLIPNMTFSSVPNYANPSLSEGTPYYNSNTIFSVVENLSKVLNTHVIKTGLYFERTRKDQSANAATRGRMSFNRDRNNPLDTNYAYSNALLGIYDSYSEATARPQGQYRFTNLEWYIQDVWRVRPRFTIDYGLRFYHNMPQYDARNQLASFVPELYDAAKAPVLLRPARNEQGKKVALDPLTGRTYPEGLIGTYAPGVGRPAEGMVVGGRDGWPRGMYTIPAVQVAPRLGFALDPSGRGRTAIRGGGGIFYDRIQGNPTMGLLGNPPTIFTPTVYYGTLDALAATQASGVLAPSASVTSMYGGQKLPTTYNFSFGVQHQLDRGLVLDVSYVGSLTRHFAWQRNINAVPIGARFLDLNPQNRDPTTNRELAPNFLRPYQGYGDIFLFEFGSSSNYNSFQLRVNRRMKQGYISFAYTFSKVLGVASTDTTRVSPFFDPRERNYGPLSFDRPQVASMRYNYRLPRPGRALHMKKLGLISDGWEISGITRWMSGPPFTPGFSLVSGQDITGTPSEGARINILDPSAPPLERFGRPERGTFGNAGVGILRRPGMNNWDVSLYRQLRFSERLTGQLRLETYNTFNHTQFNAITTNARFDNAGAQVDPLFLQPTTARSPRRVQLAIRVNW